MSDPVHPEGIYACEGCGWTFAEYVNGCPHCWDDDLTIEENQRKYPRRKVVLVAADWRVEVGGLSLPPKEPRG